jgi:pimeloyl-ACP methyl ester carboxylesterase
VRGLRYHVRHWGDPQAPKIFMMHGWMDMSASFQFMVDALQQEWHVIAPDWRGFGLSEPRRSPTGSPTTWPTWTPSSTTMPAKPSTCWATAWAATW